MEQAVSDEMLDTLALAGTARECLDIDNVPSRYTKWWSGFQR